MKHGVKTRDTDLVSGSACQALLPNVTLERESETPRHSPLAPAEMAADPTSPHTRGPCRPQPLSLKHGAHEPQAVESKGLVFLERGLHRPSHCVLLPPQERTSRTAQDRVCGLDPLVLNPNAYNSEQ